MTFKKKLVKNFIVQNILGLLGFIYIYILLELHLKLTTRINPFLNIFGKIKNLLF